MHTRSDWRARPPVKTRRLVAAHVKGVCVHYAGFAIDPTRPTDALLRSIQTGHIDRLGWWDIAYNLAVDQAGEVWACRGLDIESGAQGGRILNRRYVAIVALVGPGQPIPEPMVDGIARAVALARRQWPGALDIVPHSQVKATSCPGDLLRGLLADGALEPGSDPALRGPALPTVLRRGATGTDVARLQRALGPDIAADGKFGPMTEQRLLAVQAFIAPWLGPATGVVTEQTWAWVLWTEGL